MHVEFPIVSFICTALVLSPLPWHWRARNIPTLSLIFWLTVVNFPRGINTVIWAGNVINHAPVWCDIVTKLEIGTHYALASSTVCVSRNLAQISSLYYTTPSVAQRRAQLTFEIFMCAGWPAIGMILHIIVQAYRFLIIEDFGCKRSIYGSLPSVFLVSLPPIMCSLATSVYSAISLRWLIHRRARFRAALPHHPSWLTNACHLRLIALSITMMISIPCMTVFVFIINLTNSGLRPWVSWDYVHEDWQRIAYYEKKFVLQADWNRYLITWYMIPFISVIFFAFFGLGWEIKEEYTTYACFAKTRIFHIKHKDRSVLPVSASCGNTDNSTVTALKAVSGLSGSSVSSSSGDKGETHSLPVHSTSWPPCPADYHAKDTSHSDESNS